VTGLDLRPLDKYRVAKGHLDGLAQGWGGFAVLRTTEERLENAAVGADVSGDSELAIELRGVASTLSDVHTPDQAREVSIRLDTSLERAWNLGKRCKGISPELFRQAQEIARRVRDNKITREEALEEISSE